MIILIRPFVSYQPMTNYKLKPQDIEEGLPPPFPLSTTIPGIITLIIMVV